MAAAPTAAISLTVLAPERQMMRSACAMAAVNFDGQTELTARFPLHVVCAWLGNSAPIADKHYLQVTEAHYAEGAQSHTSGTRVEKATQNPTQQAHAAGGLESHGPMAELQNSLDVPTIAASCDILHNCPLPPRGVEPLFSG